jgi:N-acetylmuramoyl-L-alanine amidase
MANPSVVSRIAAAAFACLAALHAGAAERAEARVSLDATGPSTRLVLTLSRSVGFKTEPGEGRITVAFAEPVAFVPADSKLDDPILVSWEARGDRTLVLSTGPAFKRLESFELKNPARVVLDLLGERTAKAAATAALARAEATPGRVVVIDPGHGGVENGATGPSGLVEKDVSLDLARRLETRLEREGGVTVVLTRDEDRLVPLDERAAIANHNRAELFVSVHLNASKRRGAVGAETYFLSPDATDDEARTLAALENRASGVDETAAAKATPSGLDLILWDLAQNQYLAESGRLAESVQRELNALAGT